MRIIEKEKEVVLDEEVTVKMTLGELALITGLIGNYNQIEIKCAIDRSDMKPELKNSVSAELVEVLYDESASFLEKKGVFRGF